MEEFYARNLGRYYEALTVSPSHNYYAGRANADITDWVEYLCEGVATSFESVRHRVQEALGIGALDQSVVLRRLDPRQRKALELDAPRSPTAPEWRSGWFRFRQCLRDPWARPSASRQAGGLS